MTLLKKAAAAKPAALNFVIDALGAIACASITTAFVFYALGALL